MEPPGVAPLGELRAAGVVGGPGFVIAVPIDIALPVNERFLTGLFLAPQHAGAFLGLEYFG
jgi:hypothetical protein